jgi:dihydrofolate reductase
MGSIVVFTHVSLDGVMQAPGRSDEDRRGDFAHGGWARPNNDAVMASVVGAGMGKSGGLLLGRRTYEDFAAFWPKQPQPNPFTALLDATQKYVASTTLRSPLPWSNSTLLAGDATEAVAELKRKPGLDLVVLGSGELVRSLLRRKLVDEFLLLVHPLVLGSGRRLFPGEGPYASLRLIESQTTTKGVVIARYDARADDEKGGEKDQKGQR